jgi:UDP:flavonoid glycosyltransferase YjiC (YdhE family)
MLEERGLGVGVNKNQLTREVISDALNKIINNERFVFVVE